MRPTSMLLPQPMPPLDSCEAAEDLPFPCFPFLAVLLGALGLGAGWLPISKVCAAAAPASETATTSEKIWRKNFAVGTVIFPGALPSSRSQEYAKAAHASHVPIATARSLSSRGYAGAIPAAALPFCGTQMPPMRNALPASINLCQARPHALEKTRAAASESKLLLNSLEEYLGLKFPLQPCGRGGAAFGDRTAGIGGARAAAVDAVAAQLL